MRLEGDSAYVRIDGVPQLQLSIVAFADLLGTKDHARAPEVRVTLAELDKALRQARAESQIDDSAPWFHTSWFSDSVSIAAPASVLPGRFGRSFDELSVGSVLLTLMWLQYRLAIKGFFLRGGLTVGLHFVDSEINYGPALVDAVGLEAEAIYPRIMVDEAFLAVVSEHFGDHAANDNPFTEELITAPDGRTFVSYLGVVLEGDDDEEAEKMMKLHRSAILTALVNRTNSSDSVLKKYQWLAQYHDAFCGHYFPTQPTLLLDVTPGTFLPYRP